MTARTSQEVVRIADGVSVPLIGFGTWELNRDDAYSGVRAALDIGYRHIDTATAYENEDAVGKAVRDSGVGRENVFITTKCPPSYVGREAETIDASLKALGVDFVDLWLVHWPGGSVASGRATGRRTARPARTPGRRSSRRLSRARPARSA